MFRKLFVIFIGVFLIAGIVSATKMKSSWKNSSATPQDLQFKKVLVAVIVRQPYTRKIAEDKAVRVLQANRKVEAVASYTIFENVDTDKETAKAKIAEMGFDGIVLIRQADEPDTKKYDEKAAESWNDYNWFWGIWGGTYNAQFRDDNLLYLETLLFSMKDQKLIWAGITETKNPKNPAQVVGEIAEENAKLLQKEGLIPKQK